MPQPHAAGEPSNIECYTQKHLSMVGQLVADLLSGAWDEGSVSGGMPGTEPAVAAIAQLAFGSFKALQAALGQHAQALLADIPRFANIQPVVQVSEVLA